MSHDEFFAAFDRYCEENNISDAAKYAQLAQGTERNVKWRIEMSDAISKEAADRLNENYDEMAALPVTAWANDDDGWNPDMCRTMFLSGYATAMQDLDVKSNKRIVLSLPLVVAGELTRNDEICAHVMTVAGDSRHVCYLDKGHDGEHVCMGCAEKSVVPQTHTQRWAEQ
jgi:hypothetical protein